MYRALLFLASIPLFYSVPVSIRPKKPIVGALWNLGQMGECELHYHPLCYNNYGCWCGVGGSHEPVDGIDRCCMLHDKCYDAAVDKKLCHDVAWEYIDNYKWKCTNSTATCLDTHPCEKALCECDMAVVKCWSQFPKPTQRQRCNRSRQPPKSDYFQH